MVTGLGAMVMVNTAEAVDLSPSVACAVKVKVPAVEGVLEMIPEFPSRESPAGRAPPVIAHV